MTTVLTLVLAVTLSVMEGAGQEEPPPRRSADGSKLPDVENVPFDAPPLPYVAKGLGAPPEVLLGARKFYRAGSGERATALRQTLSAAYLEGFAYGTPAEAEYTTEWYGEAVGGAKACGFDLKGGRVTRVLLCFDKFTEARAKSLVDRLARLDRESKPESLLVRANVDGVRISCRVVGSYTTGKVRADGSRSSQMNSAVVVINIDPVDWFLLAHEVGPATAEAMRRGAIEVGMTKEQCDVVWTGAEKQERTRTADKALIIYCHPAFRGTPLYTVEFVNNLAVRVTRHEIEAEAVEMPR
jgi:hypothetical protein